MLQDLQEQIQRVPWYHTIDFGNGICTPGLFDHRQFLHHYGLPDDLSGKSALDIGAASGFFSFELERRGAQVTAVDLPGWFEHDFGPHYQLDQPTEDAEIYLTQPFEIAHRLLESTVQKKYLNVYQVSPETVGEHDITFCGSLLIHLTDPIKALWNIASVTREKAIIATSISPAHTDQPIAFMVGHHRGDGWWIPTRTCLELMAVSAGFDGVEWYSEFSLDHANGTPGPYHGVLHAYKKNAQWSEKTVSREEIINRPLPATPPHEEIQIQLQQQLQHLNSEVARLETLVRGYEDGRFMRFSKWLHEKVSKLW
jgi:tRNA (mo5U34)-methyltransferase